MSLEGIVSKRRDSRYRSGRQESWFKLKCVKSDTFPIVAFVEKLGARPRSISASEKATSCSTPARRARATPRRWPREVRERLDPLIRKKSPLSVPVKKPKATWVEPVVDAEIEYSSSTDDGLLRAAVFKGLREDVELPKRRAAPAVSRHTGEPSTHGAPRARATASAKIIKA